MKCQLIATLGLTFTTTALASIYLTAISRQVKAESTVQFICRTSYDQDEGKRLPTTLAWTSRGKIAIIRWAKNLGGRSPEERCQAVSPRFQKAFNDGTLNLITNGRIEGQSVICTAKEFGGDCQTVLMTLRPEDKSLVMLNSLKDILRGTQVGPIKHSSGGSQIYYQVNINEFLQNAPVEKNE